MSPARVLHCGLRSKVTFEQTDLFKSMVLISCATIKILSTKLIKPVLFMYI